MNEVSNGPAGNHEYFEFVVVSNAVTYTCTNLTPPFIDIRGWIFDDNSGTSSPINSTIYFAAMGALFVNIIEKENKPKQQQHDN